MNHLRNLFLTVNETLIVSYNCCEDPWSGYSNLDCLGQVLIIDLRLNIDWESIVLHMNRHKNESIAINLNALTKVHRYTLQDCTSNFICLSTDTCTAYYEIYFFIPYLILINLTQLILKPKNVKIVNGNNNDNLKKWQIYYDHSYPYY